MVKMEEIFRYNWHETNIAEFLHRHSLPVLCEETDIATFIRNYRESYLADYDAVIRDGNIKGFSDETYRSLYAQKSSNAITFDKIIAAIKACVADVFIDLWRDPNSYDTSRGSMKTFLALKCRNKSIDRFRRLSAHIADELSEEQISELPEPFAIISYQNVQAIMSMDSQKEAGLQFVDNICSVVRLHKSGTDEFGFYKLIEKHVKEV